MSSKILMVQQAFKLDISKVFEFFSRPENLERITPPDLHFKILTPLPIKMEEGALIEYKIRISFIPVRWKTLISKFEAPRLFVDEQISGPYAKWHHTHSFIFKDGYTIVEDKVEYTLPISGFIGDLVNKFYIERMLKKIFEYRFYTISKIFKKDFPYLDLDDSKPNITIA